MKPGELERTLSRLVETARIARERLAAIERELAELRHTMEKLAVQPDPVTDGGGRQVTGDLAVEPEEQEPGAGRPPSRASTGSGPASMEAHGATGRDSVLRSESEPSGREVSSK